MESCITISSLKNGEKVALSALDILRIPHFSIINSETTEETVVEKHKLDTIRMLNELFQNYKSQCEEKRGVADVSYELLWLTEPAVNQPYKAKIKLYIIVRAIDWDEIKAKEAVASNMSIIRSTLTSHKYEVDVASYSAVSQRVRLIDDSAIKAIIKEERIEDLQNQLFPVCYSYGRFQPAQSDLSGLVNILINYPNTAISMQLIPTALSNPEASALDFFAHNLEGVGRGVMNPRPGYSGCALAEQHADEYKYYSEHKFSALFMDNLLVYGDCEAASSVANRICSELSTRREKMADLRIIDLNKNEVRKDTNFFPLPWAINELLLNKGRNAQIWNSHCFSKALYRFPYIITSEEAAEFFRLPIAGNYISAGLDISESEKKSRSYAASIINAGDITIGKLKASSNNDTLGITLNDLTKHMLVVGTPGSGKTTFSVSLMDRLWKDHGIPFLVIEPAKNEYRALVQSIPDLQIFTPGKNHISPFVFNPFVPPKNVKLESYKSTLKTAFSAAVPMTTPLDKIFEETINNCYSKFGWVDTYTTDDPGRIFNISDFIKCFEETFEAIGYTGDAKNIGRAGVVRLNSMQSLFDNYYSIPIEDLLSKPTVIELAAIENSDQKALIIALLLLSILAYVNANYHGDGKLKNAILIEEAHVLLDANISTSQGGANPSEIAQSLIKRMLAEIRSYGVGMIVADQSPRKVTADVVAMTDIKIAFRLVEGMDRQILADSIGMSEVQERRLSRLKQGEAFLFFGKLDEPEEILIPDYRREQNIDITLSDEEIKRRSTYWKDKSVLLRPYPQCSLCRECAVSCDYSCRVLGREIARRIFMSNFTPEMQSFEPVKNVLSQIARLTASELKQPLTRELLACVKVHLWRRIRYGTKIPVRDIQIESSLKI